jgi:1,4-alpha-glucan branching enzyme
MITIQKNNRKNSKVQVTFTMPPMRGCGCLYLVGTFEKWNESVYRMQREDDGAWSLTLELEPGRELQYRFRTDNGIWIDDSSAPPEVKPFVSEGSLVSTSAETLLA